MRNETTAHLTTCYFRHQQDSIERHGWFFVKNYTAPYQRQNHIFRAMLQKMKKTKYWKNFAGIKKKRLKKMAPFLKLADEEKAIYAKLLQEADRKAQIIAEKRVPLSIDISLLGGGWSFIPQVSPHLQK